MLLPALSLSGRTGIFVQGWCFLVLSPLFKCLTLQRRRRQGQSWLTLICICGVGRSMFVKLWKLCRQLAGVPRWEGICLSWMFLVALADSTCILPFTSVCVCYKCLYWLLVPHTAWAWYPALFCREKLLTLVQRLCFSWQNPCSVQNTWGKA